MKLNSNIRCIEILLDGQQQFSQYQLNSNIRCIEIEEYEEYGIPVVS